MSEDISYKMVFYFDFGSLTRKSAKNLLENIFLKSPSLISFGGTSEDRLLDIDKGFIPEAAKIIANYPRYFSSKYFLKSKNKQLVFMLEYIAVKLPVLHVFIYGQEIDFQSLKDFFVDLSKIKGVVFSGFELYKDYEKKHNYVSISGKYEIEERFGEDFENGIPGLYKSSFFSQTLVSDLKLDQLKNVGLESYVEDKEGTFIDIPNSEALDWIFSLVDQKYFFDISDPHSQRITPTRISKRINFLTHLNRKTIPQYTKEDLGLKANSLERHLEFLLKIKPELDDQNCTLKSAIKIFKTLNDFNQTAFGTEPFNKIWGCGLWLGLYWAKKFGVDFDKVNGLKFERNRRPFFLNPYNCLALFYEDNLDLNHFESYSISFFKIK